MALGPDGSEFQERNMKQFALDGKKKRPWDMFIYALIM